MAEFASAADILTLQPDQMQLAKIHVGPATNMGNVIAASSGMGAGHTDHDVVSRVFVPGSGIPEDPATGSAHCVLSPYFSDKLNQKDLTCFQAYPGRGGIIETSVEEDRVKLRGKAVTVVEGQFHLD